MVSKRFEGILTVEWEDHVEVCHVKERTREKFLERLNDARIEIFKYIPEGTHVKTNYRGDFAAGFAEKLRARTLLKNV